MIKSVYGEQYVVYPFGSTCYGAGRATSDLDLIVLVGTANLALPSLQLTLLTLG